MAAHRPGDRQALEAALAPHEKTTLIGWCRAHGIVLERWHTKPGLARLFEAAAWLNLTEQLSSNGMTRERAQLAAACRLGLEVETMRRRGERLR